ncbi:MAG TPA: type II toxin-antitoxin system HicA family toxin [Gemmataceae bacterium]|jgi:predicted RNA binding protein YcfA (HicA-like mRNA interferase family)|nr:type II toxin-antitoxin system HicA family toxin [Gemmataceae bacterium]
MKLPRDLSGADLMKALGRVGYSVTRQKSSHIRLSTDRNGSHHVTVPDHEAIKVGTLADILKDVAAHLGLDRDVLLKELFG